VDGIRLLISGTVVERQEKEEEMTPLLPPARIEFMMLLHLRVGLRLYVIPKYSSRELRELRELEALEEDFYLLSKRNTKVNT
jgi:hypothetical protein